MANDQNPVWIGKDSIPTFHQIPITKREYFAAIAMQGILSQGMRNHQSVSKYSVEAADQLLAELSKTETQ